MPDMSDAIDMSRIMELEYKRLRFGERQFIEQVVARQNDLFPFYNDVEGTVRAYTPPDSIESALSKEGIFYNKVRGGLTPLSHLMIVSNTGKKSHVLDGTLAIETKLEGAPGLQHRDISGDMILRVSPHALATYLEEEIFWQSRLMQLRYTASNVRVIRDGETAFKEKAARLKWLHKQQDRLIESVTENICTWHDVSDWRGVQAEFVLTPISPYAREEARVLPVVSMRLIPDTRKLGASCMELVLSDNGKALVVKSNPKPEAYGKRARVFNTILWGSSKEFLRWDESLDMADVKP